MTWQEYQEAVAELYRRLDGAGTVSHNIYRPDRVTGQRRQVDVWVELETKGHKLGILVDAKKYSEPVDVTDVDSVAALADAVGARMAVIVCSAGWTEPAEVKARFLSLDLRLLSIEEALQLHFEDEIWEVCSDCHEHAILIEAMPYLRYGWEGPMSVYCEGQCKGCGLIKLWCWDCGSRIYLEDGDTFRCSCGHIWGSKDRELRVAFWEEEEDFKGETGFNLTEPEAPTPP